MIIRLNFSYFFFFFRKFKVRNYVDPKLKPPLLVDAGVPKLNDIIFIYEFMQSFVVYLRNLKI